MLRGNLATRPFYNDRVVSLGIILLALVVLALTAFNLVRLVSISTIRGEVEARLTATRSEAAAVRADMSALRQGVDPATLSSLAVSTEEANRLIAARTFSWTTLLGVLEGAMPADVRLVSIAPRVDNNGLKVSMTIVAREIVHVNDFMDALADTGAFYDLLPTETQARDDGTYAAQIESSYLAPPPAAGSQTAEEQP